MYISVLRQASRSTREIGASFTRSLRPKITARRRSLLTWWWALTRSKYFSRYGGGTPSTKIVPGVGVAEERGDVDQNRVEQCREFFRAGLQSIQILVEAGLARLLHPVP